MTRKAILSVLAGAMAVTVLAQPAVTQAQAASAALGTVRLTRGVMADGKPLAAGSYTLRVGADAVTPVSG